MKLSTVLASSILIASGVSASLTLKAPVKPVECIEKLTDSPKKVKDRDFSECVVACVDSNNGTHVRSLTKAINGNKKTLLPMVKAKDLKKLLSTQDGCIALNDIISKIDQKVIDSAMREDVERNVSAMLKSNNSGVQDYTWVPITYFKKQENVVALFEHFSKSTGVTSARGEVQKFFTFLTAKQFIALQKFPKFHKSTLTAASLNAIAEMPASDHQKALLSAIHSIDSDFMASLYNRNVNPVALHKKIAMNLPEDYLKTLNYMPHPEDAKYYTEKQAAKAGKLFDGIDLSHAKKSVIQALNNPKAIQRVAGNEDVRPKITVAQWNSLTEKSKNCTHMKIEKIENLHLLKVSPKCFPELDAETQSYFLLTHPNLEDNILAHMDRAKMELLKHPKKDASGLAILDYIASENKAEIVANLGADEDIEDKHFPCYHMTLDDVNEIKALSQNISRKAVMSLKIESLDEDEVAKFAHILAKHEDVFELINNLDADVKEKNLAKESIWVTMKPETFAKLATVELAKNMTSSVFALIPAANRAKASGAFVANLPFLKDLNKEKYATLPETAFDAITKASIGSIRIADMSDAQFANLSAAVKEASESAFSAIAPADFAKMPTERLAVIKSKQWSSVTPAAFKAIFVAKETFAAIPAPATVSWIAAQLKDVATAALAGLTAQQVEVMGSEVADANASALSFLIANKAALNEAAQAALAKRSCEIQNSASMATVSSAVIAAVALLALF